MKHLDKLFLFFIAVSAAFSSFAQAPGSVSLYGDGNSEKSISGGTASDISETLYIGAGTHTVNGVWQIYSKNIIISSAAIIKGAGTIEFYNPSAAGGAESATFIDGNYNTKAISVNVKLNNASGMELLNMKLPKELSTAGWTEDADAGNIAFDKQLDLAVDGANVVLGVDATGDLVFTSNGTIANYGPSRMVVTNNSIISHVVKQNYTAAFVFPVGIAASDYSPAQISNTSAIDVKVSVQDYTSSASDESVFTDYGMHRTWHIYGGTAGTGTHITLQHASALNEKKFNQSKHFVTQYSNDNANNSGDNFGTTPWQENTPGPGAVAAMRKATTSAYTAKSRSYVSLPASSSSKLAYFTKRSPADHGTTLPIKIIELEAKSLTQAILIQLTAALDNEVKALELHRSSNGMHFHKVHEWHAVSSHGVDDFTFHDHTATSDHLYFYRVKVSYNTGTIEYSAVTSTRPLHKHGERVTLYPNPSSEFIYVKGLPANKPTTMVITDVSGKAWQQVSTSDPVKRLNIQRLPAGIYFIRIFEEKGTVYFSGKFLKQ